MTTVGKDGATEMSDVIDVTLGIPQGSILGPILFIIFTNDFDDIKEDFDNVEIVRYADDKNIIIKAKTYPEAVSKTELVMCNAGNWFRSNGLLLNDEKTKSVLFQTSHSGFITPDKMILEGIPIELCPSIKFLGVYLDETLNWTKHIEEVCKSLSRICFSMRVISGYLNFSTMKTIYYGVFESRVRYGILFYGSSKQLYDVMVMQKRILRIMLKLKPLESCTVEGSGIMGF